MQIQVNCTARCAGTRQKSCAYLLTRRAISLPRDPWTTPPSSGMLTQEQVCVVSCFVRICAVIFNACALSIGDTTSVDTGGALGGFFCSLSLLGSECHCGVVFTPRPGSRPAVESVCQKISETAEQGMCWTNSTQMTVKTETQSEYECVHVTCTCIRIFGKYEGTRVSDLSTTLLGVVAFSHSHLCVCTSMWYLCYYGVIVCFGVRAFT